MIYDIILFYIISYLNIDDTVNLSKIVNINKIFKHNDRYIFNYIQNNYINIKNKSYIQNLNITNLEFLERLNNSKINCILCGKRLKLKIFVVISYLNNKCSQIIKYHQKCIKSYKQTKKKNKMCNVLCPITNKNLIGFECIDI